MAAREPDDEEWFTRIYAAHYGDIVNYGRRRLAEVDAAVELAQDVFVVAWRRRAEVPDRHLPWLYGVARRLLANRWRADRGSPAPLPLPELERVAGVAPARPDDERLVDVRAALALLTEADQEILRLIGWEELTVREAAQVLGCTRGSAAVRLHRARRRLIAAMATARPAARPSPSPLAIVSDAATFVKDSPC
jgi:RNA polymerase sigma factor (sigma-70 family)